jgi:hypothetical protein
VTSRANNFSNGREASVGFDLDLDEIFETGLRTLLDGLAGLSGPRAANGGTRS